MLSIQLACLLLFSLVLSINGQSDDLAELQQLEETPFTMPGGATYRDMLTIGASQAVAKFASRYELEERNTILQARAKAQHQTQVQTPRFFSSTLAQPIGRPHLERMTFDVSRSISIPEELRADRALADKDEEDMLAAKDSLDNGLTSDSYSQGVGVPLNSYSSGAPTLGFASKPTLNYNYNINHGHPVGSYSYTTYS